MKREMLLGVLALAWLLTSCGQPVASPTPEADPFDAVREHIERLVAEGDMVAFRVNMRGTHKGEFMGIAPTGKQITMASAFFYRFEGGKEVEALPYSDTLALFQQLGVSPPTG